MKSKLRFMYDLLRTEHCNFGCSVSKDLRSHYRINHAKSCTKNNVAFASFDKVCPNCETDANIYEDRCGHCECMTCGWDGPPSALRTTKVKVVKENGAREFPYRHVTIKDVAFFVNDDNDGDGGGSDYIPDWIDITPTPTWENTNPIDPTEPESECDCGGKKCKTTHVYWCKTNEEKK